MNRRVRRLSSERQSTAAATYLRYLKPGALAQLRDSRISARSNRVHSQAQISLLLASSPARSAVATQIGAIDGFPCFSGRIFGPRCPQRKKLVASKSIYFLSSSPSSPVSEAPNPIIDMFSSDFLVAH